MRGGALGRSMDDTKTARRKLLDEGFSMTRIGNHADQRTIVAEHSAARIIRSLASTLRAPASSNSST